MSPTTCRNTASLWFVAATVCGCLLTLGTSPSLVSAAEDRAPPPGKILLVRGMFTVFSLGLDDLADLLNQEGLETEVIPASLSYGTAERIAAEYAEGETCGPLVLIGHSLGADLLPPLARQFCGHGLQVDLMVMIDSTNPADAPPNVRRCVNLYQSNLSPPWFRIFRGAPINAECEETELINVDVRQLPERDEMNGLNHFNIDTSCVVHRMVVNEVLTVVRSGRETAVAGRRPGSSMQAPRQAVVPSSEARSDR